MHESENTLKQPTGGDVERRRSARVPLPVSAQIIAASLGHFGFPVRLRDVSAAGAYFYCDQILDVGTMVRIDFSVSVSGREMGITCEGTVVRFDASAQDGINGVALKVARYNLANL